MKQRSKLFAAMIIACAVATKLFSAMPAAAPSTRLEGNLMGQLFAIAEHRCGLVFDAKTLEERKAVLEKMPLETKDRILEELAQMVLGENEHPFLIPQDLDYSQLDMFFLLAITLMSHDRGLCDGLTRCIGERELFKLKVRLDKVMALVSPSVKEKLTPAPGYRAQMGFVSKVKSRMGTKAKPMQ